MPVRAIPGCPSCNRRKTGVPGAMYFDIFQCDDCKERYCGSSACGASGCPKCKSRKQSWWGKVRSPSLFEFATRRDFDQQLPTLATLAPEDWSFGEQRSDPWVLRSYLSSTFARLQTERKVALRDRAAAFNTGLVTDLQEEIYGLFRPSSRKYPDQVPWQLVGFFRQSDNEVRAFRGLELARYHRSASDLIYDSDIELVPDVKHIIQDNKTRFPAEV